MGATPPGYNAPTEEIFSEWQYIYQERLGILCGKNTPIDMEEARARFEADRHIEQLWPVECRNGWLAKDP